MRTVLDNGLTVLLKETHTAPVTSFWVAYRVGSRNEPTGKTGISHWVEHMMFKGTDKFPAGVLDKEIDRNGGQWNAFTSMDYTMYHETLPAERIGIALEAESDRMMNAKFDIEEVESERTVIISERQGAENEPMFWLREQLRATTFHVHGYHHEIIGDMVDLHTMTRDDLYHHYRQHYAPANAAIIVVGDFQSDAMLTRIQDLFGTLPGGEHPKAFNRAEPPQTGERRIKVERPGDTAFLEVAYRVPDALHDDWYKLNVLDSALTGPGGGIDNRTSRLYKALVQSEIAVTASGGMTATIDPYVYTFTVTLRDGRTHEEAETVLDAEIERIIESGITESELAKAKKQARAVAAYSGESVSEQAYWLARSEILSNHTWFEDRTEKLQAVTVDDIVEVARRYLRPQNRTVGWLIPTGS